MNTVGVLPESAALRTPIYTSNLAQKNALANPKTRTDTVTPSPFAHVTTDEPSAAVAVTVRLRPLLAVVFWLVRGVGRIIARYPACESVGGSLLNRNQIRRSGNLRS